MPRKRSRDNEARRGSTLASGQNSRPRIAGGRGNAPPVTPSPLRLMDIYAIEYWTHVPSAYWMIRLQNLIAKNMIPAKRKGELGTMKKGSCWMAELSKEVQKAVSLAKTGDHNIVAAMVMSTLLALWTCRVCRSKCYDPRRDREDRRQGMNRLLKYQHAIFDAMTDESRDHEFFWNQPWDIPWLPEPKSKGKKR